MKTAPTPFRPLLLTLGALAAIAVVAWSVLPRAQAPRHAPGEPRTTQSAVVSAPEAPLAAASAAAETPASEPRKATEAPAAAGLKVYFDPEAGGITNVPPRSAAVPLAGAAMVRPERLPEITLEDGSAMVRLDERFEETMVMSLDANGRRVVTCSQHPGAVHPHVHAEALPADTREVK